MARKKRYKRIKLLKVISRQGDNVTVSRQTYNKMKNLLITNPDLMVYYFNNSKVPKLKTKYSKTIYTLQIDDETCGETIFNTTKRWKVAFKALLLILTGKMKKITKRFDNNKVRLTVNTEATVKHGNTEFFIDRKEII